MKIIKSFNENLNQENLNNLYNAINDDITIDEFENNENNFEENNIIIDDDIDIIDDLDNSQDDINNESNESNDLLDYVITNYNLDKNYINILNEFDNFEIKENKSSLINIIKQPKERKNDGLS